MAKAIMSSRRYRLRIVRMAALATVAVTLGLAAFSEGDRPGARYNNEQFGFSLTVPGQFTPGKANNLESGRFWVSRDGQASLIAVALANEAGMKLHDYRKFVIEKSYKGAVFNYTPVKAYWFVLSRRLGEDEFYQRVTYACGGRYIYGWEMVYPVADRGFYDKLVEAVHRSYRAGRGENGQCGPSPEPR